MSYTVEDIKILRAKTSAGMSLCKEALEASNGDMNKAIEYINGKSDAVSRLRDLTGAKIGLCKLALNDTNNDFEKAVELIKERGWDNPVVENEDVKYEGIIDSYVHGIDKKLVASVEVICKTDFVAKNDAFRKFVHEVVLQIAAMKPEYISSNEISQDKLQEMRDLYARELREEGKPENMIEKIVDGKISKYLEEKCLLNQKWFKDDSKTIQNLLDDIIQTSGEPILIRRMLVWELGK